MKRNRWGGGVFEFNEPKASSGTEHNNTNTPEQNKNEPEPEPVSSTKKSEVAKPSSKFSIVDLKEYDVAEKTLQYFQVNLETKKLKMKPKKSIKELISTSY